MEQRAKTSRTNAKQTTDYYGRDPYLFIVGCARSGTTLVRRIVDAHPEIAITTEMHWISHYFDYCSELVSLIAKTAGCPAHATAAFRTASTTSARVSSASRKHKYLFHATSTNSRKP